MATPEILVGATVFRGWKTVEIVRSIETIAGRFSLTASAPHGTAIPGAGIREKDACAVRVDGRPLITGFVDRRTVRFDPDTHEVTIAGRDRSADLVDCSLNLTRWEFRNVRVLSFLNTLTEPYGVSVTLGPGAVLPPIPERRISIDVGETPFNVIDRVARFAGVLPVSDGVGGVQLMIPGTSVAPVALAEGRNLKAAECDFIENERFARYVVHGVQSSGGDLLLDEEPEITRVEGVASDDDARPGRVFVMRAEQPAGLSRVKARAEWEARVRRARATRPRFTLRGWSPVPGYVWRPGDRVPVNSPTLGIQGSMIIARVTLALSDDEGETARLELAPPDAFAPIPQAERSWKK